jgi:TonB family protein
MLDSKFEKSWGKARMTSQYHSAVWRLRFLIHWLGRSEPGESAMKSAYIEPSPFSAHGKHPLTAALLSVLPGCGQIYVGDKRKGALFIGVAIANALLCTLCLQSTFLYNYLSQSAPIWHMRLNDQAATVLKHLEPGAPASLLLFAAVLVFALYCARDAYDRAFFERIRPIYKSFVIDLSEANSFSYLMHFTMIVCLTVMALFFVAAPPSELDKRPIVIEFERKQPEKHIRANNVSTRAAAAHGNKPHPVDTPAKQQPMKMPSNSQAAPAAASPSPPKPPAPSPTKVETPVPTPAPKPVLHVPPAKVQPAPAPALPQPVIQRMPTAQMPAASIKVGQPPLPSPTAVKPAIPDRNPLDRQAPLSSHIAAASLPAAPLPKAAAVGVGFFAPKLIGHGAGSPAAPSISAFPIPGLTGSDQAGPPQPISASTNLAHGSDGPLVPHAVRTGTSNATDGNHNAPAPEKSHTSHGPGNDVIAIAPRLGHPDSEGTDDPSSRADLRQPSVAADPVISWDPGPYMATLQRRIKHHWLPPKAPTSHVTVLTFHILSDGTVTDIHLSRSSGLESADRMAIQAVEDSKPLPPLPKGAPAEVDIEFTFTYDVFGHADGAFRRF